MRRAITIYALTLVTALAALAVWGCCGFVRHAIVAVDRLGDAGAGFAQTAARLNDPNKGTIKMLDEDVGATKSLIVHADLLARHEEQSLATWDRDGATIFDNIDGGVTDLRGTARAATSTLNATTTTLTDAQPMLTDADGALRAFESTAPDVQRAIKGLADTTQQTAAIGANLNATTHDLQVALHPILNPDPCKTRGCKIKRDLSAAKSIGPGAEGLYYLIQIFRDIH